MKVEKIQQDYNSYRNGSNIRKSVSFQHSNPSIKDMITDSLPAKKVIKKMKDLEWLKGEVGGILITALGTGLVAPFPIAFNPMVKAPKGATEQQKEDLENTKYYTAWRQPISAILAIIFQVAALTPIDKFLGKIFNQGEYSKHFRFNLDQSVINDKGYVEDLVKAEYKAQKKSKPSYFKGFKDGFKKIAEARDKFDDEFKARVDKVRDEQVTALADDFMKKGRIQVGERFLDNETLATFVNEQIQNYVDDAKKLKIDEEGLAFYSKRAKMLVENKARLNEIFANVPQDKKDLKTYLNNLLEKEKSKDVKILLEEITKLDADMQHSRITRTLDRIKSIEFLCDREYSFEKYLNSMLERNKELNKLITDLELLRIENPKAATQEVITDTIQKTVNTCCFENKNKTMQAVLQDTDTFNSDKLKLKKKVHKDIVKSYRELLKNNYKSYNQVAKVVIGVCITLPITCNVLNWVYPRIMNKFFPELAGAKAKTDPRMQAKLKELNNEKIEGEDD